jgi:hypothetical protein
MLLGLLCFEAARLHETVKHYEYTSCAQFKPSKDAPRWPVYPKYICQAFVMVLAILCRCYAASPHSMFLIVEQLNKTTYKHYI